MVEGQMVQIVLFAFIFGVALLSLSVEKARPLVDLLRALQEVCMSVVRWAMLIAPFAVFGLMAQLTSRTGVATLLGLGVYVITVLIGLFCLMLLYLVTLRILSNERPLAFLGNVRELLLLAFSTSSSAAVMPLSMKTAIEKFNVRSHVAQFVIPLGATINMNGTAVYQAIAAVFLAQVYQVELSLASLVLIVLTAVGASIG
jgi:Na+/H+-dicarboxylate symporter